MKTFFHSFTAFIFFALAGLSLSAQPASSRIAFTATLTGGSEVPAVTTNGRGFVTVMLSEDLKKMDIYGVISGLSGPATAAHFHTGVAGQNGGVVVNLVPLMKKNRISGSLPVSATLLRQMMGFGIYVNVHTALNPGGEVRGQLEPVTDLSFGAVANGLEEVPPVITTAVGVGGIQFRAGSGKVIVRFMARGLSGPATAAHIHEGAIGVAGPVVVPIPISNAAAGSLVGEIAESALPADFIQKALAGKYYINVHTAANPGGEIRGQLRFGGALNGFASLNGDQETPPVTTAASGFGAATLNATLDSLTYVVLVSGLSGPPTAAHIHKAAAGVAGGVVVPLTASLLPGLYTATVAAGETFIQDFVKNNLYFNVHTAANPAGEVRGQIETNARVAYAFDVCGAQEVPAAINPALGVGFVSIDQGNTGASYRVLVDSLSGAPTAAHFHTGVEGANGGVLFPLTAPNPYSEGSFAVTGPQALLFGNGSLYFNVHTAAKPGGEARGQVRRALTCAQALDVFDPAVSALKVFPNPVEDLLNLRFESGEAFSGRLILSNAMGQVVQERMLEVQSGDQSLDWSVATLAQGVYYLALTRNDAKRVFSHVVVKM